MNGIKIKNHKLITYKIKKITLSYFNDKSNILNNEL